MVDQSINGRGSMVASATQFISRQLDAVSEWAEARSRAGPLDRRELEEVVAAGNFVFGRIRAIDAEWTAEFAASGAEPPLADAQTMEGLYAGWRDRARPWLERAAALDRLGQPVRGADDLAAAYAEVQAVLSVPVGRLRRAAQSVREGRTRRRSEVRDALHRRTGTGS